MEVYRLEVYHLEVYRLKPYRLGIYRLEVYRLGVYRSEVYRLEVSRLEVYRSRAHRSKVHRWKFLHWKVPGLEVCRSNVDHRNQDVFLVGVLAMANRLATIVCVFGNRRLSRPGGQGCHQAAHSKTLRSNRNRLKLGMGIPRLRGVAPFSYEL